MRISISPSLSNSRLDRRRVQHQGLRVYLLRFRLGFRSVSHRHSLLVVLHKVPPQLMLGPLRQMQSSQLFLLGRSHLIRVGTKTELGHRLMV